MSYTKVGNLVGGSRFYLCPADSIPWLVRSQVESYTLVEKYGGQEFPELHLVTENFLVWAPTVGGKSQHSE